MFESAFCNETLAGLGWNCPGLGTEPSGSWWEAQDMWGEGRTTVNSMSQSGLSSGPSSWAETPELGGGLRRPCGRQGFPGKIVGGPSMPGVGRWSYWIISSELRRNFENEKWSRQLHKVQLWSLLWGTYIEAGRIGQTDDPEAFEDALCAAERGTAGLKEPKVKTESDYQVRSTSTLTATGGFPPPGGLVTFNHLCQQKTCFQFSHQMKAGVHVDRELIWLGCVPREEAEAQPRGEGSGGTVGLGGSWRTESVWFSCTPGHPRSFILRMLGQQEWSWVS